MRSLRKLDAVIVLVTMLLLAVPVQAAELQVTATFSVIADLVAAVGGERVEVSSLVVGGNDPHGWEPTPRHARQLASTDVLFYNGGGLELWIDRLIESASRPDLPIVILAEELERHAAADSRHDHHEEGDPHLWLDVSNAIHYVEVIAQTLQAIDVQGANYYAANARAYIEELEALDRWLFDVVEQIPPENRKMVAYHDAFGHFSRRYGIEVVGHLVTNHHREPSAREMAAIAKLLKQLNRPVVFSEPQFASGDRFTEALARETGAKVFELLTGSLTAEAPSYIEMMRHNGKVLLEALQ